MIRTQRIMPSCSSKVCVTPKAPGRESPLNLSTGRSRSFGTSLVSSSPTAIDSSTPHTSKSRRSRASPNLPLRWHFCSPAVTERNEPKSMAVLPTASRHPSCSMWQQIWCGCVRRFPNGSRYWIPRNGSFISRRAVSTRCSLPMLATNTVSTPTAWCLTSCTPSRTASSLML